MQLNYCFKLIKTLRVLIWNNIAYCIFLVFHKIFKIKRAAYKVIFPLVILFPLVYSSQKIDRIFDSVIINKPMSMLNENVSRENIIKWNQQMLKKAEENNYPRGIALLYINLATQNYHLGKPEVSLEYLNKAKKIAKSTDFDPVIYARLNQEFAQVYYTMGLFEISMNYNAKAIYYAKKSEKNTQNSKFLNYVYISRAASLGNTKKDSCLYYAHKAIYHYRNPNSYGYLANYYITNKTHLDSAKYYLDKAELIFKKTKISNMYYLSVLNYYYGKLYLAEKKYEKAIDYLEKALSLASNGKNRQHLIGVYDDLATAYQKTGNFEKERKLLDDYKKFNDSYRESFTKSVEKTLLNIQEDKENESTRWTKNYFIFGTFGFSAFIFILYRFSRKNKHKSEEKKQEKYTLSSNSKIIEKTIDNSPIITIDTLYKSAKLRDPNFNTKFQTLYPNFVKKLLDINPSLQNSEIHLLMYIYLKFETKEIAEILFLSPKTIQNRKYNIRKKLNIPTNKDIYIWLISLD